MALDARFTDTPAMAMRWALPVLLSAAAACGGMLTMRGGSRAGAADPAAPAPPGAGTGVARPEAGAPPQLVAEFRGAWVATVDNIDWPSRKGLPAAAARAELDAIVARAAALGLNALVFQVRPAADAMYRSNKEPWSEWLTGEQGRAPDEVWDPLDHVIAECHRHGIELHAWFNPFRASHPAGKSKPAANHVRRRLPDACRQYGEYTWMDPGDERARRWTLDVILDVVLRYDVDGVHLDDYFYPYPEGKLRFADDGTYARYRLGGGKQALGDWRRANIDGFVQLLYDAVHAEKTWVKVGISPFGIARPGQPAGIRAGIDQYEDLSADVVKWLRAGWLDYLAPQLYWPIDQKPQSFAALLPWWHGENTRQRHLWPGLNAGRCLQQKAPMRPQELADQLALIREHADPGAIHYSFKALRSDAPNVGAVLRRQLYAEPAVVPASPWLGLEAPPMPRAERRPSATGSVLSWDRDARAHFVAIQIRDGAGWHTLRIVDAQQGRIDLPAGDFAVALRAIGRTGVQSPATVL